MPVLPLRRPPSRPRQSLLSHSLSQGCQPSLGLSKEVFYVRPVSSDDSNLPCHRPYAHRTHVKLPPASHTTPTQRESTRLGQLSRGAKFSGALTGCSYLCKYVVSLVSPSSCTLILSVATRLPSISGPTFSGYLFLYFSKKGSLES